MSQERVDQAADRTLSVLRDIWTARGQSGADLGEGFVSNARVCKRSAQLGLGDVDDDLRAAWRARLRREGKLNADGESVGELVSRTAGEK